MDPAPPRIQKRAAFAFQGFAALHRLGVDRALVGWQIAITRASRVPITGKRLENREVGAPRQRSDCFQPNLLESAKTDIGPAEQEIAAAPRALLGRRAAAHARRESIAGCI